MAQQNSYPAYQQIPVMEQQTAVGKQDDPTSDVRDALVGQGTEDIWQASNANGSACLSRDGLRNAVQMAGVQISDAELDQLFQELDANGDGTITHEEFLDGLNARPSIGSLEGTISLLKAPEIGILEHLAEILLRRLAARLRLPHSAKIDMPAVMDCICAEDLRHAWREAEVAPPPANDRPARSSCNIGH